MAYLTNPTITTAEQIAAFALRARYDDFADQAEDGLAQQRLKLSVLDTLGCGIGALDGEPVRRIRALNDDWANGNNAV